MIIHILYMQICKRDVAGWPTPSSPPHGVVVRGAMVLCAAFAVGFMVCCAQLCYPRDYAMHGSTFVHIGTHISVFDANPCIPYSTFTLPGV